MKVPAAAPTRLVPAEAEAVREAVARVIHDGPWILGPEVTGFEDGLGTYADLRHAVGVGNGTDALAIAFAALGLSPGAGVLVAANEGGYAATAARLAGLEPRRDGRRRATRWRPPSRRPRAADRPGVEAIVVTHLHGDAVALAGLDALAPRPRAGAGRGLRPGARPPRRRREHVGATGDAATFSFYPTKNLGAVGDGGAVGLHRRGRRRACRGRLRQYGWGDALPRRAPARPQHHGSIPLQAAVLAARLPFLDERNARRRAIAALVRRSARLVGPAARRPRHHRRPPRRGRDATTATRSPRTWRPRASTRRCTTRTWSTRCRAWRRREATTRVAAALRGQILSLPCFPELTEDEIDPRLRGALSWAVRP